MCLAIYKPSKLTIPKQNLQNGYRSNWSDHCGCGFAWNENGKLHITKGLFTFDEFYEKYKEVEQHPMLVHFRMATHKPVDVANCHPFAMCDGTFALIHNGVFSIPIKDTSLSDTGNFCKYIMEPTIKEGRYKNKQLLEKIMGWNMCALMSASGEVIIYNEHKDQWNEGVWYSNRGYGWSGWEGYE